MLSVTLEILQENAEVGSVDEEGRRKLFGEILQKLTATQTDRAAYMKLYSRKLSDVRVNRLETDEPIDFLFCNVHCLLAFTDIAEKILDERLEQEKGEGQEALLTVLTGQLPDLCNPGGPEFGLPWR